MYHVTICLPFKLLVVLELEKVYNDLLCLLHRIIPATTMVQLARFPALLSREVSFLVRLCAGMLTSDGQPLFGSDHGVGIWWHDSHNSISLDQFRFASSLRLVEWSHLGPLGLATTSQIVRKHLTFFGSKQAQKSKLGDSRRKSWQFLGLPGYYLGLLPVSSQGLLIRACFMLHGRQSRTYRPLSSLTDSECKVFAIFLVLARTESY
jgi:hypothetical protein